MALNGGANVYHCNLKIHLLSGSTQFEILREVEPPERITCSFATYTVAKEESLRCDILIVDLGSKAADILPQVSPKTQVILCAEAQEMVRIQELAGNCCADFWLKPFSPAFAAARFERLLAAIKTEKDGWLAQNYLDTAIDSIPDLVWFKDIRGSHEKVNNAFCQAVGKEKQDVQGRGHYYIWDLEPDEYAKGEYVCLETEEEVLRRRETCLFDEKVKSKHGLRQFKTYKSPIFGEEGELLGTVGIAHDVTDLENVGTELQIFMSSMPFAILVENEQGTVINANGKFTEYFGIAREEILGKHYDEWKKQALGELESANAEGYAEAIIEIGGENKILEIHEEPIFDIFDNHVGHLCICRDVTVERRLEQQILRNSNIDFLTGVYNRRYFYDYIGKHRGTQRISLIYMDLDLFKRVNDTYGHQVGDEALARTAHLLEVCFPEGFITRLGGDEFLVTLLGDWSLDTLIAWTERFQHHMAESFRSSPQLRGLSASIGIAQTDDAAVGIDTLIQQSDQALYIAKQSGRAQCCVYTEEMNVL